VYLVLFAAMCTSACLLGLDDCVSDGFADLFNYDALGPLHNLPCSQQEFKDFDSLFQSDYVPPYHFSALPDLALTDAFLSEINTSSEYPGELDLQHDLQEDVTVEFDFADAGLPPPPDIWLELQHNECELPAPRDDEVAFPTSRIEDVTIEPGINTALPNEPPDDMEVDVMKSLASNAPSREDAMCSIAVLSDFLHLQPAGSLSEATIIQGMIEEFRSSKKRRRTSATSLEFEHNLKEGRMSISGITKELLEQSFSTDPYIKNDALESLSIETGLPTRSIRTWFANARSRKAGLVRKYHHTGLRLQKLHE
jgi:hypothetical protein